jgi:hypothetical protein
MDAIALLTPFVGRVAFVNRAVDSRRSQTLRETEPSDAAAGN